MFKFILISTITKLINSSAFNHEPKGHKKSAELCLLFTQRHRQTPTATIIKQQPALYNGIVLFSTKSKKEEYSQSASIYCPLFRCCKKLAIFLSRNNLRKCLMSYIDSVIFGNAIPSGIDAKVRTIYESARKISEFFPELPFLWTKT